MKSLITRLGKLGIVCSALPFIANAQISAEKLIELREEAGIMQNIIQASLKQGQSTGIRFRPDSAYYLVEQGVVFTISTGGKLNHLFGIDFENILSHVPKAPLIDELAEHQIEIDIDDEKIEKLVLGFMGHESQIFRENRERMRALDAEERELAWENRELERHQRDLSFQLRNEDEKQQKLTQKELDKLEEKKAKLAVKTKQFKEYRAEVEAQQKQALEKKDAQAKRLYQQSLANFEETIAKVLCRYGAGLQALNDNETVTFILNDTVPAKSSGTVKSHDKVYVFKKKDVMSCVIGKLDKNKLLSIASTYVF